MKRSEGLCPLTPEEASMVLQALGLDNNTHIYIAAGEIYGSERRLKTLRKAFPHTVSIAVHHEGYINRRHFSSCT